MPGKHSEKFWLVTIINCLLILLCFASNSFSFQRVLLLHSYHVGYKWTDDITLAVQKKINRNSGVELHVEYMDTKKHYSAEYFQILKSHLQDKYANITFDAILCSDNNALNFTLDNREDLFDDVPIVFCGINYFSPDILGGHTNITGVNETTDFDKTIELMKVLHKDVKRIVVISDETVTGTILHNKTKRYADNDPSVRWLFLRGESRQQLVTQLRAFEKGDLVLLNLYLKDETGHMEFDESARLIAQNSSVPVYGSWDFFLGHGVVGGYMTNGYYQGDKAAGMVVQILSGSPADSIPVLMKSPNEFQADYSMVEKFSISEKFFPVGTLFINRPPNIYQEHKVAIWITFISCLLLSLLSLFLFLNIVRKNRAKKELWKLTSNLEKRVEQRTVELQEANSNIMEREQKMNNLLSNISGMVYRCLADEKHTLVYASKGSVGTTSYSSEELLSGKNISLHEVIYEKDRDMVSQKLNHAIEAHAPFSLEYRIVTREKKVKWVWEQGLSVENEAGEVLFLDGIITDINDRKIIELEQKKLATAVHQIDELIVITNLKAEIEYVNPAFEKVTGYQLSEVEGLNPRILKSGKQSEGIYEKMWCDIAQGDVWRGRFVNRRKDRSEYIAEVTISPIKNQSQEITHYVGVQRDITQEIILEENLRHAQKLESLGTLAGGIAHEINTPVQFVSSNLAFALESFNDLNSFISQVFKDSSVGVIGSEKIESIWKDLDIEYILDEMPLALKQSIEGVEQVSKIVLSMKQFAHPGEDSKVDSDINEAIKNTATVCRNEWKYIADMEYDLDPLLPQVPCNISEINQVVLNLIINAAHAIGDRGFEDDKRGILRITTRSLGSEVQVTIEDNGGGIPEDVQERIFDPFFTTKVVGKGSGQGLAIAHSIITQKHNGRLYFENTDQGTKFYITLPINVETKI